MRAVLMAACALMCVSSSRARAEAEDDPGSSPTSAADLVSDAGKADEARERAAEESEALASRRDAESKLANPSVAAGDEKTRKELGDELRRRLVSIDEIAKLNKERMAAENPVPDPDRQAAELNAELERVQVLLRSSERSPQALLPKRFELDGGVPSDALISSLREAIAAERTEQSGWTEKLEQLGVESKGKPVDALAKLRAERDRIHRRMNELHAEEGRKVVEGSTPIERILVHERRESRKWEIRAETARLAARKAQIELEKRRVELAGPRRAVISARLDLNKKTLEQLQLRYKAWVETRVTDLAAESERERRRAETLADPLERDRAERNAVVLELESKTQAAENDLAVAEWPVLEEERIAADQAEANLERVRKLLDDGHLSELDAMRLNNDFKRIAPERARIVDKDLRAINVRLAAFGNDLSAVELEIESDVHDERLEMQSLLERLPNSRHNEAVSQFESFDKRIDALLDRRRAALEKLVTRDEQTQQQIQRRIAALDDHYGFIRTHLFWVRDREPLGTSTPARVRREATRISYAFDDLARSMRATPGWTQPSRDFLAIAGLLVALPAPFWLASRRLGRIKFEEVAPASPFADLATTVSIPGVTPPTL